MFVCVCVHMLNPPSPLLRPRWSNMVKQACSTIEHWPVPGACTVGGGGAGGMCSEFHHASMVGSRPPATSPVRNSSPMFKRTFQQRRCHSPHADPPIYGFPIPCSVERESAIDAVFKPPGTLQHICSYSSSLSAHQHYSGHPLQLASPTQSLHPEEQKVLLALSHA